MSRQHMCSECQRLTRTSPEQKFLRCDFWCRAHVKDAAGYIPDEWQDDARAYSALHCHMQPEAPACGAFKAKEAA